MEALLNQLCFNIINIINIINWYFKQLSVYFPAARHGVAKAEIFIMPANNIIGFTKGIGSKT